MNVSFAKADLASHILWMCPHMWQDQFNLHENGMTPLDMHSLILSLKAIERLCNQERSNAQSNKKASHKSKNGNKRPGTNSMSRDLKNACTKKHYGLCKKHGDAYTTHNTKNCCKYEEDGMEKSKFCTVKKGGRKPNPTKQSIAQMRETINKLKKAIKKQDAKKKKRCRSDSDFDSQ
jgi:hypothetical protein